VLNVTSGIAGTSIQLGHIRFYVDPAMIDRVKLPISQLSSAYSDTCISAENPKRAIRPSTTSSASDLHLEIHKLSVQVYSPYVQPKTGRSQCARGRVGLETGTLYLGRTQVDHIQAGLDWLTVSLGQLTGKWSWKRKKRHTLNCRH
jgi:hypothetical protein